MKIFILLISFFTFANLTLVPDFYHVLSNPSVKYNESVLTESQLQSVKNILQVIQQDRDNASLLTEELLKSLGFHFARLNVAPPHNFKITKVPQNYFFKDYLDKVLSLNGEIILVFDEPLGRLTSHAGPEGIWLDPQRFLLALYKPLAVIPHEVMHFVHMSELKEGKSSPYNSSILANEPLLATYKKGFVMDEIEAHLGDARLMKFRGQIAGESYLDATGKAALVYMMVTQVRTALEFIEFSIKTDAESYLQDSTHAEIDSQQFGFPFTSIALVYKDQKSESLFLQFIAHIAPEEVDRDYIQKLVLIHKTWVQETFETINLEFRINSFEKAGKILREQAGPLIN